MCCSQETKLVNCGNLEHTVIKLRNVNIIENKLKTFMTTYLMEINDESRAEEEIEEYNDNEEGEFQGEEGYLTMRKVFRGKIKRVTRTTKISMNW